MSLWERRSRRNLPMPKPASILFALFALSIATGCSSYPEKSNDFYIAVESEGGCLIPCHSYRLRIDRKGAISYKERVPAQVEKRPKKQLSVEELESLRNAVAQSKFFDQATPYCGDQIDDATSFSLLIVDGHQVRRVQRHFGCSAYRRDSDSAIELYLLIETLAGFRD